MVIQRDRTMIPPWQYVISKPSSEKHYRHSFVRATITSVTVS